MKLGMRSRIDIPMLILPNSQSSRMDGFGQVIVKVIRTGAKEYPLFKANGDLNEKVSKTIKDALGPPVDEVLQALDAEESRRIEKVNELKTARREAPENQRPAFDRQIQLEQNEIDRVQQERESAFKRG